jgi:DNA-binding response OmpR family regulator
MIAEPSRPLRVFIVDEEYLFASCVAQFLKLEGLAAYCFDDPLEALFAARSAPPDLLISDVALELPTGIHLATRIREDFPACRVLLFSKDVKTNNLLASAASAGNETMVVPAPVDLPAFMERIHGLIHSALPPGRVA